MKFGKILCACFLGLILSTITLSAGGGQEGEFRDLFNGRDLTGWEGSSQLWSVQDGAITGQTTEASPVPRNQFLIWQGESPKNFELRMQVRLEGNNNSGIQYRSQRLPELGEYVVGGYQADIHLNAEYNAMLYEERGRGIVAEHGQKVIIDEQGVKWIVGSTGPVSQADLGDWTEYTVIVQGNHLVHKLNGKTAVEIIDHQVAKRALEGIIALQVHQGPPMKVQFKSIQLKKLPDGGILSPESTPIPKDAKKVP
ncbi:MAG TPA: DUF1080 domain-containing protein [Acidobacteriota bacterium]|nr:DUF1080 domain-containing protein [Acidobacteriota bacterium]